MVPLKEMVFRHKLLYFNSVILEPLARHVEEAAILGVFAIPCSLFLYALKLFGKEKYGANLYVQIEKKFDQGQLKGGNFKIIEKIPTRV